MLKYFYFSFIFAIFPIIQTQIYPTNMNQAICCPPQYYGCESPFNSLPGIIKYVDGNEMQIILPNRDEIRERCSCLSCQLSKGINSKQLRILYDLEYQQELAANFSKFIDEFMETCPPPPSPYYSNDLNLFNSLREIQHKYYLDYYNLQWTGWKYLAIAFIIAFCISTIVAIALAVIICCKIGRSK